MTVYDEVLMSNLQSMKTLADETQSAAYLREGKLSTMNRMSQILEFKASISRLLMFFISVIKMHTNLVLSSLVKRQRYAKSQIMYR